MDEATATAITEQFGCWKRLKGKLYGGLEHPKQLVSCAMRVLPKPDEYRCDDDQAYLVHKGLSTETVKVSVWAVPQRLSYFRVLVADSVQASYKPSFPVARAGS